MLWLVGENATGPGKPYTVTEALARPDADRWKVATEDDVKGLSGGRSPTNPTAR